MPTNKITALVTSVLAGLGLAACSGAGGPAVLEGALTPGAYKVNNPVIIATSLAGTTYVSHVTGDGSFSLTVPVGTTYQLSLANTIAKNRYAVVSRINWGTDDGSARFVTLELGGAIDLGTIRPADWAATLVAGPATVIGSTASDDDGKAEIVDTCVTPDTSDSESSHKLAGHHGRPAGTGKPVADDELTPTDQPAAPAAPADPNNAKKVIICHIPPGNPANAHTISVGAPAVPAHLAHGDYVGACLPQTPVTPVPCTEVTPTDPTPTDPTPTPDMAGGSIDPVPTPTPTAPPGSTCLVNADCGAPQICVDNICGLYVL